VGRVHAEGVLVALPGVLELAFGLEDEAAHVRQVIADRRPRSGTDVPIKKIFPPKNWRKNRRFLLKLLLVFAKI
jgi:hypothetical protein